uniref:Uncharacterized protein n=1 Tax=Anguilla anguilla TaxID=7936 RepID=A0A0E9T7E1_ANGAN
MNIFPSIVFLQIYCDIRRDNIPVLAHILCSVAMSR